VKTKAKTQNTKKAISWYKPLNAVERINMWNTYTKGQQAALKLAIEIFAPGEKYIIEKW